MFKRTWVFVALLVGLVSNVAGAGPLRMDYSINDLGSGSFRYDFKLVLDNADNSWVSGQEWDWIIFGVTDSAASYKGFDTNGSGTDGLEWTTISYTSPISTIQPTYGGYNGPTLHIGGSPLLPGWKPTAVGQSIAWSGTSKVLFQPGEMRWTALAFGGGAAWEMQTANAVPDQPSTMFLGTLGLACLLMLRRRLV